METTLPGLVVKEYTIDCPLNRGSVTEERQIKVFARVVSGLEGTHKPYLLFLQGGPGNEAPRPWLQPSSPAWLSRALEDYQVVLLDQRGTGRSSAISESLLDHMPAVLVAEYLSHMRADAIVDDCEAMREYLGIKQWSVLGQSFGGFCALRYLNEYPESLKEVYFTGGLPAIGRNTEEIYAQTYKKMILRSNQYYSWFPEDRAKVMRLVDLATEGSIVLPNGDVVSPSRIRSLGSLLGASKGPMLMHWLLENDPFSSVFKCDLANLLPFGQRNPLYAVIHESCYVNGGKSDWAAARVQPNDYDEDPTLLTGEHLMPEWFVQESHLRPWREVANLIAEQQWPKLYDKDRFNEIKVNGAAAIYQNDVYVPVEYSLETVKLLPKVVPFVTSEYDHDGLRSGGGKLLDRLIKLAKGMLLS